MAKAGKARADGPQAASLARSPTHLLYRTLQLAVDLHSQASGSAAVTQRQHTVLAAAALADGQTQNDLVRATGIDRSTLADLVARMLAKGLLERQRSASDGRANTVRLSEAGRAVLAGSAAAAASADARLLDHLPAKKRDGFVKALTLLAAVADGGEPPARPAAEKAAGARKGKTRRPDGLAKAAKPDKKKKRKKAKRIAA